MPTYKLPPEKKRRDRDEPQSVGISSVDYMRRITIPVNAAILDSVRTGDRVQVTLLGEVRETSERENGEGKTERAVMVKVSQVSMYPADERDEDEEEAFEKGFEKPYQD